MDFVIFPQGLIWYPIVANDGVGHGEYLARKGGIGQGFRVTNHTGAEDNLASSFSYIPKRGTFKDRSILQQ